MLIQTSQINIYNIKIYLKNAKEDLYKWDHFDQPKSKRDTYLTMTNCLRNELKPTGISPIQKMVLFNLDRTSTIQSHE